MKKLGISPKVNDLVEKPDDRLDIYLPIDLKLALEDALSEGESFQPTIIEAISRFIRLPAPNALLVPIRDFSKPVRMSVRVPSRLKNDLNEFKEKCGFWEITPIVVAAIEGYLSANK